MGTNKIFKTIDEQINIFKDKGLIIKDVEKASDIVFRENYFFISGYRHLFMHNMSDRYFIKGTTFEELYAVFLFDRHLRNIMFKYLLIIENNIKSVLSYTLSKKYGYHEKDYLNVKNFTQDSMKVRQVKDVINKMRRQIRVNGKEHTATLHYISHYGYIPMWILVKVLSFGIISELYSILKTDDQITIGNIYELDPETLSIYLSIVSNYRNVCAHEEVLYMHRTQRVIPNSKYHKYLDIPTIENEYVYGKNDLFALMIIMKQLLTEEEFHDLVNEVGYEMDLLDGRVDTVSLGSILNKIGFPSNWRDISNLE